MKGTTLIAIAALLALASGCGGTSSGKILVDINGNKITEGDLKFLGEVNPRIMSQIETPAGQRRILDNLVEQELLYEDAIKQGLNRDSKVKAKVDLYRRVIIAQSLVDAETDKAAKKYYDEHQDEFKKLRLAHIMVKFATPEEIKKAPKGEKPLAEAEALHKAEALGARIDKGEEFAKVATELSDDAASKSRSGDLGLVSKDDKRLAGRGFSPLVDKALEMKVGEVSGPIKTDKGYHLVTVTRGLEVEPFDEAKEAILFKVRGEVRTALLAKLRKDAKVTYPEEAKAQAKVKDKAEDAKGAASSAPESSADKQIEGELQAATKDVQKAKEETQQASEDLGKARQELLKAARKIPPSEAPSEKKKN